MGQGGWASSTSRIKLADVKISTSSQVSHYKLKNDSLIYKIPSKQSASFSFKYEVVKPISSKIGCKAILEVGYIDPLTGDASKFQHILFDDGKL